MPIYLYEVLTQQGAPTGERFEEFQSMKDDPLTKDSQGRPCRLVIVPPKIGNKDLHGKAQILQDIMCQPHEVKKVRELYGDLGHVFQDDGSVKVSSKQEARKVFQREKDIMATFADKKAAGKLPTKAERRAARAATLAGTR